VHLTGPVRIAGSEPAAAVTGVSGRGREVRLAARARACVMGFGRRVEGLFNAGRGSDGWAGLG
jgi:hypothetical protein